MQSEEGDTQQPPSHAHKKVEVPALLQTTRRFANMRVGEHVRVQAS